MKENLLILGAGQFGLLVKEIAESTGRFVKIDFLDDNASAAVGPLEAYAALRESYGSAVVAIGNPEIRLRWVRRLQEGDYEVATLVSPGAVVMPSAVLGVGTVVEPLAVVQSNAAVGDGCIVSSGAVVRHNAVLGDACHCDCNSVVLSSAKVPGGTKVPCGQVYS